jgi:response regulator NasT
MLNPDLLILDYDLGDMTGFQVSEVIVNENLGSVILLANQIQKDYAEQNFEYPYLICLRKPLNKAVLLNTVEISLKSRKGIKMLENEIERLKDDIQSRKVIEKAKGILMRTLDIDEEEAYARIRKRSMDSQMPMKAVAGIIIATMDGD